MPLIPLDRSKLRGILPIMRRVGLALGLVLLASACRPASYTWHGTEYEPPRPAPAISLAAHDGTTFDPRAGDEKVRLVYFGYIHCPDVCPATLANIASVYESLGPEAENLQTAFVTVDPERDTLPALAEYLAAFDKSILGVRGERDALQPILDAYGVYAGLDVSSTSHEIEHSGRLFLIDAQGLLRAHYPWDIPPADLLADVSHLLDETG